MRARRDVLESTYRIRVNDGTGTAFCVNKAGRLYFVTARHAFANFNSADFNGCIGSFDVINRTDGIVMTLAGVTVYFSDDGSDIAVFEVPFASVLRWIDFGALDGNGMCMGEDVLFVGFPFVFDCGYQLPNPDVTIPFYLPIVKSGIVSTFENLRTKTFLVDGHNNCGFSGGPVVIKSEDNGSVICGVVSGFLVDRYPGQPEGDLNSGFLRAVPIKYAVDLINRIAVGAGCV